MGNFISKAWDDLTGKTQAKQAANAATNATNAANNATQQGINRARTDYVDYANRADYTLGNGYGDSLNPLNEGYDNGLNTIRIGENNASAQLVNSGNQAAKTIDSGVLSAGNEVRNYGGSAVQSIDRGTQAAIDELRRSSNAASGNLQSGYDRAIDRSASALAKAKASQQPYNEATSSSAALATDAWQRMLGLKEGADPTATLNSSPVLQYRLKQANDATARALRARGINDSGTGARLSAEAADRVTADEADKYVKKLADMAQYGQQGATRLSDLEMQGGAQDVALQTGRGKALADLTSDTGKTIASATQAGSQNKAQLQSEMGGRLSGIQQTGAQNKAQIQTDTGRAISDLTGKTANVVGNALIEKGKSVSDTTKDLARQRSGIYLDTGASLANLSGASGQALANNFSNQAAIAAAKANQPSTLDTLVKLGGLFI